MAVTKINGIELKAIERVYFGGFWKQIKPESFKEESEGYSFEDTNGNKYFTTQYGLTAVSTVEN